MEKLIRIKRGPQCWVAQFCIGSKPDPEIVKLFGTHELPTPFAPSVPFETVEKEIATRNPDYWITGHPSNRL